MEIHSISKGVTLFSLMLKQIGQALQAPDSVHSAEALETVQEITNECQVVFDDIKEMLDKMTSRKPDGTLSLSVQQRFRWCFKKDESNIAGAARIFEDEFTGHAANTAAG